MLPGLGLGRKRQMPLQGAGAGRGGPFLSRVRIGLWEGKREESLIPRFCNWWVTSWDDSEGHQSLGLSPSIITHRVLAGRFAGVSVVGTAGHMRMDRAVAPSLAMNGPRACRRRGRCKGGRAWVSHGLALLSVVWDVSGEGVLSSSSLSKEQVPVIKRMRHLAFREPMSGYISNRLLLSRERRAKN